LIGYYTKSDKEGFITWYQEAVTLKSASSSSFKTDEKGKKFDDISIQDIVEEGGISRMAYYS
jgi:hypothetical protein